MSADAHAGVNATPASVMSSLNAKSAFLARASSGGSPRGPGFDTDATARRRPDPPDPPDAAASRSPRTASYGHAFLSSSASAPPPRAIIPRIDEIPSAAAAAASDATSLTPTIAGGAINVPVNAACDSALTRLFRPRALSPGPKSSSHAPSSSQTTPADAVVSSSA
eukprot:30474-Pelagococcus_subviridis.AAC.2